MLAKQQNTPYLHVPVKYGAKVQYAPVTDQSTPLDKEGKKFIQKVCGKFLYLGRVVNLTILVALSAITAQQSLETMETKRKAN